MMDRTRKGVRAANGPRAENQFWWFEDVGTANSGASKREGSYLRLLDVCITQL